VVLRPLLAGDGPAYAAAFREDDQMGRLLGVEDDPTEAEVARRVEGARKRARVGRGAQLAVCTALDGAFVGEVLLHTFAWKHLRCEIGFWLTPAARGQGLARDAIERTLEWAFEELAIERMEMTTTTDNAPTRGLFGFTFGTLDVAWPAFAHSHGSAATAGIFLSLFAVGAGIGGLLYGARRHTRPAISTYPALCLLAAAGLAPLIAAHSLAAMAALALLSGLCFAPITTAQVAAVDEVAVAAHRAEAYTWLGTIYAVGAPAGAASAGQLIAASGEQAAFIAGCGATAAAAMLAALKRDALDDAHAA
jgi:RimJ/RimL family protein N-acetyltransferase